MKCKIFHGAANNVETDVNRWLDGTQDIKYILQSGGDNYNTLTIFYTWRVPRI